MSSFENYDSVSQTYDVIRNPEGVDVELAMLQFYTGKALKELHVLDAGCGTGSYAKIFLQRGVGKVTMLDASDGMLKQAKTKLQDEIIAGRVPSVVKATLPDIPFPDESFDCVVFNMVFHHLGKHPDGDKFPEIEQTLTEAHRVVKPQGIVIIIIMLPSTINKSFWYAQINRSITERCIKRFITLAQLEEILTSQRFKVLNEMNVFMKELKAVYYNAEGPLQKEWRETNSFWKDATDEEITDVQNKVRQMKDEGTLEQYMRDNDKALESGVWTMVVSRAV